jgi:hypothetical protein
MNENESSGSSGSSTNASGSATQSIDSVLAQSPAQSMGMMYQNMSHSLSLSMQNAVTTQNALQQIATSIVSASCAKIVASAGS